MSIEHALGADIKRLHTFQTPVDKKHGTPKRPEYKKHWEKYFTFTVVRNPWDRVVSSYFFDLAMPILTPTRKQVKRFGRDNFKKFLKLYFKDCNLINHWCRQSRWLCADYDFVMRYESLESDFRKLSRHIDVDSDLEHKNPSDHLPYKEYYDQESIDIVAEKYKKDIDSLGYTF